MGTEWVHRLGIDPSRNSREDADPGATVGWEHEEGRLPSCWPALIAYAAGALATASLVVDVKATLAVLLLAGLAVFVSVTRSLKNLQSTIVRVQEATNVAATATRELAAEHARLLAILVSQKEAVIATDEHWRVVLMNPSAEALTGWPATSAMGRPVTEIVELEPAAQASANGLWKGTEAICQRVLETGEAFDEVGSVALISRQGKRRVAAVSVAVLVPPSGDEGDREAPKTGRGGIVVTMCEISSYMEKLAHAQQQERLDIVDGMIGALERIGRRIPGPLDQHVAAEPEFWRGQEAPDMLGTSDLGRNGERTGGEVVGRILPHAGPPRAASDTLFTPADLLEDVAHFLPRLVGPRYKVVVPPSDPSMRLAADFVALREALLRLALAGRPSQRAVGGALTLRARRVSTRSEGVPSAAFGTISAGSYVRIDIEDSGSSSSRQQLLHLFEPWRFEAHDDFVNALAVAKGYRLVRQMRGGLLVESRRYHGSTLAVCLPEYGVGAPRSRA